MIAIPCDKEQWIFGILNQAIEIFDNLVTIIDLITFDMTTEHIQDKIIAFRKFISALIKVFDDV